MATGEPAQRIGDVIGGRYRIDALIGSGAASWVFAVEDTVEHRRAALKVLKLPDRDDDPIVAARLVREAKAMAMFDHPNIVDFLDAGALPDGSPFLVTELVEGMSLRAALEEGALDVRRALAITRQILLALEHAHERGVIHRDIKPENIMLTPARANAAESVKVLDFGVAKLMQDAMAVLGEATLTRAGHDVIGTPMYLAPEPLLGHLVDARSDLYSVGCVLFELLCGQPPFPGTDSLAIVRMHASAEVPTLARTAPGRAFTQELELVVGEALAKRPELRFRSAAEMRAAVDVANRSFDALLGGGTIQSLVPPLVHVAKKEPPRAEPQEVFTTRQLRWAVVGTGALALVVGTIAAVATGDASPGPTRNAEVRPPSARITLAPADSPRNLVERAHVRLASGRRLDALSMYEQAIDRDRSLALDTTIRDRVASVVETRDVAAAIVALELLATRLAPPARDVIADQASRGKVLEIRWRALAIAERDGFVGRVDRVASWSLDLAQVKTCDERKEAIARLESTNDRRAIAALRKAKTTHACVARAATAAVAALEADH